MGCRNKSHVTGKMGRGFLLGKGPGSTAKKARRGGGVGVGVLLIHAVSGDNE